MLVLRVVDVLWIITSTGGFAKACVNTRKASAAPSFARRSYIGTSYRVLLGLLGLHKLLVVVRLYNLSFHIMCI